MTKDDKDTKKNQEEVKEISETESNSADAKEKKEEELLQKVADIENRYKRVLADYQNLEKRSKEERREWIQTANKDLLLRLLPVLDTLMLASTHSQDKALQVSIQQFLDILKGEGVTKIETKGREFDPHLMECVETVEGEEGKVTKEMRAGYMLHDKVLRPAHVTVGSAKQN